MNWNEQGSRADQIRSALENEIFTGLMKPGDLIDEAAIALRFGVSRTPAREAILLLTHTGLVEKRSRKGAVVARMDLHRLIQMFELMSELEGTCARLAARRMNKEERAALTRTHAECHQALQQGNHDEFHSRSHSFHVRIIRGTHNTALIEVVDRIGIQLAPYRHFQLRYPGREEANFAEHAEVLAAILAGDGDCAAALFRKHATVQGDALVEYASAFSSNELGASNLTNETRSEKSEAMIER